MIEKEKLRELLEEARIKLDRSQDFSALNYWCKQCDEMVDRNHALRHRINDVLAVLAEASSDPISDAYRRGAEAMREQAASLFDGGNNVPGLMRSPEFRDFIRSLPIPEDK